jgi:serine/threonine protein kinase
MSMVEQEVALLQKLDHPYITSFIDVFVHPGVAMYIVMELVKGGDLFDRIAEMQRYTEVEARRTMRRLLSAVHYLHSQNIVHRDLKPENILISDSPTHVKLADFGLAKIVKSDGLKTFCGTPAYFAPEVLQRRSTVAGEGRYGKPADMWSLGVILFILLTGKFPFDADIDQPRHNFELDFDSDHSLWASMPMAQELVQQLLRLDPKRRLTVSQACDHPWINLEDGDTHCHPLDDPIVTTKKRLFEETEQRSLEEGNKSRAVIDEEISSIISKQDSVMSKEEFSHAAMYCHNRNDSISCLDTNAEDFHNMANAGVDDKQKMDASVPDFGQRSKQEEQDFRSKMDVQSPTPPGKNIGLPSSSSVCDVKQMSTDSQNGEKKLGEGDDSNEHEEFEIVDSSSPSHDSIHNEHEYSDITPSEHAFSPPRSPLEKLNLNKRCNRFRDQVLQQTTAKEECQTAVTPTLSNVRKKEQRDQIKAKDEVDAGIEEDPILSQFSSEPSSIDSFSDSSASTSSLRDNTRLEDNARTRTCHENGDKKRIIEDSMAKSAQGPPKRPRVGNSKQTTLKSWILKKQP